jgi:hypothetical protein
LTAPNAVVCIGVGFVTSDQPADMLPDHVRRGAAEKCSASGVHVADAAVAIDCDDRIGCGIEDRVREFETTPLGVAATL